MGAIGSELDLRSSFIKLRPRFQVVMNISTTVATISGNQPPSGILIAVEATSAMSTIKKIATNAPAANLFHFHNPIVTTANKMVSTIIAPVTASP